MDINLIATILTVLAPMMVLGYIVWDLITFKYVKEDEFMQKKKEIEVVNALTTIRNYCTTRDCEKCLLFVNHGCFFLNAASSSIDPERWNLTQLKEKINNYYEISRK